MAKTIIDNWKYNADCKDCMTFYPSGLKMTDARKAVAKHKADTLAAEGKAHDASFKVAW